MRATAPLLRLPALATSLPAPFAREVEQRLAALVEDLAQLLEREPPIPPPSATRRKRAGGTPPVQPLSEAMLAFERQCLLSALAHCRGRKLAAAALLGISRKTLWAKLRAHGLVGRASEPAPQQAFRTWAAPRDESGQPAAGKAAESGRGISRPPLELPLSWVRHARREARASLRDGLRTRRSRAQLEAAAERIRLYVAANPGQHARAIKHAVGLSTSEWVRPIALLLERGEVRTTGLRRLTRYYPAE